jgi:glycosyltransferase involved in cell wall biosynthesis
VVVSAELLEPAALDLVRTMARPVALDFHDDPVAQLGALGFPSDDEAALRKRVAANLDLFERIIVMSDTFRESAGLPAERCIIAPNGTDTTHIRPLPMPDRPVVGHASGAAPGRGLEQLIGAARIARGTIRDLELRLWLVATGDASEAYLRGLMADVAQEPWIRIETAPYAAIGEHLGQAMVLCVPLPTHPYLHGVLPIKLFDSMAAGRPIVATPCLETAKLLRARDAGLVTEDDTPEAIAAGLLDALADSERAARWAANARAAAVSEFDWRVIGEKVADDIARYLGRSG